MLLTTTLVRSVYYIFIFGEGYPNVIAEGMLAWVSIVRYDTGDFNLMIQNYDLGVRVSNKDEFVTSVLKIINKQTYEDQRINVINKIRA